MAVGRSSRGSSRGRGNAPPAEAGLDMRPRYAPAEVMIAGWGVRPVVRSLVHRPGTHPRSAIRDDMTALELVTDRGSRWYGVEDAYINPQLRMVVVGTNPRDEVRMKWPLVPARHRSGGGHRTSASLRRTSRPSRKPGRRSSR